MKLISHKLCPYVQRAVIALTEKGIPFERIDIDLANKPDWFLKVSPLGKVPVLLVGTADGETALFESNVICEYIEDTQGGAKLHPQDPLQRAQHRAWMEFGSTILSELWGLETTGDPAVFETKRKAVAAKFATGRENAGPGRTLRVRISAWWMRCSRRSSAISMCSIGSPIYRCSPIRRRCVSGERRWRSGRACARRSSSDYPQLLRDFLVRHDAHMLKLAA